MAGRVIPVTKEADTRDIMHALAAAIPAAVKQQENFSIKNKTGDPLSDAERYGHFLQENVKYIADGYLNQDIRIPAELMRLGSGDCKSLSLWLTSALIASGYTAGFRFAGYTKGGKYTHVYSYIVVNGKKYPIDACVYQNFNEQPYKIHKDMQVNYLAGTPVMVHDYSGADGVYGKKERQAKRAKKKEEKKSGARPRTWKKVSMAPVRGSFIPLVALNFRGLATRLQAGRKKNPEKIRKFWINMGGDPNKLYKAIDNGAKKKRILGLNTLSGQLYTNGYLHDDGYLTGVGNLDFLFGPHDEPDYLGVAAAAMAATAASALIAVTALLKQLGIGQGDKDAEALEQLALSTNPEMPGSDFVVTDPDPGVNPPNNVLARSQGEEGLPGTGFSVSPGIILALAAAAGLALKSR